MPKLGDGLFGLKVYMSYDDDGDGYDDDADGGDDDDDDDDDGEEQHDGARLQG